MKNKELKKILLDEINTAKAEIVDQFHKVNALENGTQRENEFAGIIGKCEGVLGGLRIKIEVYMEEK